MGPLALADRDLEYVTLNRSARVVKKLLILVLIVGGIVAAATALNRD